MPKVNPFPELSSLAIAFTNLFSTLSNPSQVRIVVARPPELLEVVLLGQDGADELRPVHLRFAPKLLGQPLAVVLYKVVAVFGWAALDELG